LEYEVRMKNLVLAFGLLLVAACGGNSNAPANDPSSSATPAPSTTTTTETTTTVSGGDAKPADGKCGAPTTTTSATTLDLCKADCEKLSDKAPEGSRCLPPRTECKMGCDHKFKNAK
jgi:hypothetical protein